MTLLARRIKKITAEAGDQAREYAAGEDRPMRGYVLTMSTYAGLVTALAVAAKASGRAIPAGLSGRDIVVMGAATHKLSRLLAKDPVTSPLRAPFTTFEGEAGPSELKEDVRGSGELKALGELVTCPFCASVWVATGFTAGLVFMPRTARLTAGTFAALAAADLLHFARSLLEQATQS
jgi:uncharacterized protein DUF1360